MKRQLGPVAAEERGHLFEGWIASVLRAYSDYGNLFDEWFYWAPGKGSGVEVDFLLRKGTALVAIEVKSSRNVREGELTGLRAIAELPGLRRRLVVHMGDRSLATGDGIGILPVPAFLREVETGTIFP